MNIREQFQRLIDRKQQEIKGLEFEIDKAKIYIEALQDSMRLLPKDTATAQTTLRPGTGLARARDLLIKVGKPLHITEILKGLSLPADKKHKLSLGGSLSNYVRNGQIFSRPSPNTFGLLELNGKAEAKPEEEIPEDFGSD